MNVTPLPELSRSKTSYTLKLLPIRFYSGREDARIIRTRRPARGPKKTALIIVFYTPKQIQKTTANGPRERKHNSRPEKSVKNTEVGRFCLPAAGEMHQVAIAVGRDGTADCTSILLALHTSIYMDVRAEYGANIQNTYV